MTGNSRTPKARALGSALREAREQRGLSLRKLAYDLGKDPSQLSRWENGERLPRSTDVAQILAHLGIHGDRYDEIVEMSAGTDEPRWLAVSLPEQRQQLAALLEFESTASHITEVSPLLIPGLLQTSAYARALMNAGDVPTNEVETRVTVRVGRRDALTRTNPAYLMALVGEPALRQTIDSAEVMLDQLRYLLNATKMPNVDLRITPFASGWHPGLEGPYLLIDSQQTTVVHLENRRSALFLHEDDDVLIYREATDKILKASLSSEASAQRISELIEEVERG